MKIVIAADTYTPDVNGAARFAAQLAHGMARRGHEVHVIAPSHIGRAHIVRKGDESTGIVTEHRLHSKEYPLFRGFYVALPWQCAPTIEKILRKLRPDVLHAQAHFSVGRFAVKWANRLQIPIVATNHFMPENLADHLPIPVPQFLSNAASSAAWRDLGRVFRRADRLTAPTALAVKLLHDRAKLGGGIPVSCGIDSLPYEKAAIDAGFVLNSSSRLPSKSANSAVPTALFVGRLEQEKRVDEIIRALALLPQNLPLNLQIVGQGTKLEAWQNLAKDLGVENRVTFLGYLDDEQLVRTFGACDFFVMPGIAELQSIVTLEAMSAHKPVILADAVALPHLVRHEDNGFKFKPGDIKALASYMEILAKDADLRARMGQVSAQMVKKHSLNNTLETFEDLYRQSIDINQILSAESDDSTRGKTFS